MFSRFALAVLAVTALSGCVASAVGADDAPPDTFVLLTPNAEEDPGTPRGPQLLVPEPSTLDVFAGSRIVVRVSDREVQYLANSKLADTLVRYVQVKMRRTLESARGVGAVGIPGEGLAIDYQVLSEIRSFEVDVRAPSVARVELAVKLLNDRSGNIVAQRAFRASARLGPVGEDANAAYLAALDAALDQALVDIRRWTASNV